MQALVQVSVGEGIGQAFLHHRFVGQRFQAFEEAPAGALGVEYAAGDAEMAYMHDRRAEVACGLQQGGDLRNGGVYVR
ncbi:hypothetical protein D3C85_1802730 [compost metagenome]